MQSLENQIKMGGGNPRELHLSAPLPFMGQKRTLARRFSTIVRQYPSGTTFVDLFGGSGLLSHIAKYYYPESRVVCNDFDGFHKRLEAILHTNQLLNDIRPIAGRFQRKKQIVGPARNLILELIEKREKEWGYIDFITLSQSLCFSMHYCSSLSDLRKEALYNRVRKTDYPDCSDYLSGIDVRTSDYRELFNEFKDNDDVVFIVDPPYLFTDQGAYRAHWTIKDHLDLISLMNGCNFIYFTSNKSQIIELCSWIGDKCSHANPLNGCLCEKICAITGHNSSYMDIMLYTPPHNLS